MLRRQGDAGKGRLAGAAARDRRESGIDFARGCLVLLRAARDTARVALPDRIIARAQAGLEAIRGRGGDRPRADLAHTGFVRNRSVRPEGEGVHHPDVVYRDRPARTAARPRGLQPTSRPSPSALGSLLFAGAGHSRRASERRCRAREEELCSSVRGNQPVCSCSSPPGSKKPSGLAGQLDAAERLHGRGRPFAAAAVDGNRRGERRAVAASAERLPRSPSATRCPIRSRSTAPARSPTGTKLSASRGSWSPQQQVRSSTYREVSTAGWPSRDVLIHYVRAALAHAPENGRQR